ncbi:hypothetical protein AB0H77_04870 [Streptomyces sp. NPDC050844]|uniref:hypothetical protein n=1 Tax=Streptomyces sp. NPDC050844 TaxID=3155790 RepID=UPI0033C28EF7
MAAAVGMFTGPDAAVNDPGYRQADRPPIAIHRATQSAAIPLFLGALGVAGSWELLAVLPRRSPEGLDARAEFIGYARSQEVCLEERHTGRPEAFVL